MGKIKDKVVEVYPYTFNGYEQDYTSLPSSHEIYDFLYKTRELFSFLFEKDGIFIEKFEQISRVMDIATSRLSSWLNTKPLKAPITYLSGHIMEGKTSLLHYDIKSYVNITHKVYVLDEGHELYRKPIDKLGKLSLLEIASKDLSVVENCFVSLYFARLIGFIIERNMNLADLQFVKKESISKVTTLVDRSIMDHLAFGFDEFTRAEKKQLFKLFCNLNNGFFKGIIFRSQSDFINEEIRKGKNFLDFNRLINKNVANNNMVNYEKWLNTQVRWPIENKPNREFEFKFYKSQEFFRKVCSSYWEKFLINLNHFLNYDENLYPFLFFHKYGTLNVEKIVDEQYLIKLMFYD